MVEVDVVVGTEVVPPLFPRVVEEEEEGIPEPACEPSGQVAIDATN